MKRGVTLIELMIAVAIIGIASVAAGDAAREMRARALEPVQRERALQWLEYQAGALSAGTTPSPEVSARLLAELPEATVAQRREKDVVYLTVSWKAPGGRRASRELAVIGRTR